MQAETTPQTDSLSPELVAKIRAIELRARRLVSSDVAGEYSSAFKGHGMTFEQVRGYQPGDDIRSIDWKVTARMNQPFVKEYREERELTVMLLVDVSASSAFGSQHHLKHDVAAEIAAILAYTALKSHDRVGLIVFSDTVEYALPPKKGRGHVMRIVRDILRYQRQSPGTHIRAGLDQLMRVCPRRAVVFLISDFLDDDAPDAIKSAAQKHDLTAINITDPREYELPDVGLLHIEDPETGAIHLIDSSDAHLRDSLLWQYKRRRQNLRELFRAHRIGHLDVFTHEPHLDVLLRYFRTRERRR